MAAQTHPHDAIELVVVDDLRGGADASALDELRARHGISVVALHCASAARATRNNLAAAHASGELLIFLADDFDPCPDLVATHAAYHAWNRDPVAVGIGAGLFPDEIRRDPFARWLEDSGQVFGVSMRRTMAVWPRTFFYAGNASIMKAGFDALQGFNERFPYDAWDDYEFGLRWAARGGYSQFLPGAAAAHRHLLTLEERCAAMRRAGASARMLESAHPHAPHEWRAMVMRERQPIVVGADAPAHVRIAAYLQELEGAFRRGYLSHAGLIGGLDSRRSRA
jgi:hypothetical protein